MMELQFKALAVAMALAVCATTASAQIEKDGKKYYMIGQRVGIFGGKQVPVGIYGGAPFKPKDLKTDGELTSPLLIVITSYENGELIPAKDSPTPLYMGFDVSAGKLESRMFTHALNVTWQFATSGIEFTAGGTIYRTEKEGATISFTKDGLKMDGIVKKGRSRVWRFDGFSETEKDGKRFVAIWVFDPTSKYSINIIKYRYHIPVPNADGAAALPADEKLMMAIREIEKGELVDVYLSTGQLLQRIEESSLLPGEDMPDSMVFGQVTTTRFKDIEFPGVTLRKFRREETYPIGQMDDGKWIPNKALAERLARFTDGDLVQVDLQAEQPNVLRMGMEYFVTAMAPYKLPKIGRVVAVQDKRKTSPAIIKVTVEGDDAPVVYCYEGSARLEVGQQIWFRPTSKAGKDYLKFIWWKKE